MLKPSSKKVYIYVAVLGLLIFLHFTKILSPVESMITRIFSPLLGSFYSLGNSAKILYSQQTDKRDLAKTNRQLEEDIKRLISENAKLKQTEEENKILRQSLKFLTKSGYSFVMSNVVSREKSADAGDKIIIDKGRKDGLSAGLIVLSSYGVVVGRITAVKDDISEICLAVNPQCKIAASVQNSSRTSGIVRGDLGLTVKMEFIPQTEAIKIGDIIVTSGLEPEVPSGYAIGKIADIHKENNELWQWAMIEPLADLNELSIVSVLLPKR